MYGLLGAQPFLCPSWGAGWFASAFITGHKPYVALKVAGLIDDLETLRMSVF